MFVGSVFCSFCRVSLFRLSFFIMLSECEDLLRSGPKTLAPHTVYKLLIYPQLDGKPALVVVVLQSRGLKVLCWVSQRVAAVYAVHEIHETCPSVTFYFMSELTC